MSTISGELHRLALLKSILGRPRRDELSRVALGVEGMDDAALVNWNETQYLVVASDFVRGSGFFLFQLGYMDYYDVGYYLIAANASDLAAMGATPLAATTVVRYNESMTDGDFCKVFEGMTAAASNFDLEIIGGDIGGHSADVFVATVLGTIAKDRVLLRSGAREGDLLCLTGCIGRPITALTYFKKALPLGFRLDTESENRLLASWRRPYARVREGQELAKLGVVHACQDVSDGLKASIDQISAASTKHFTIYSNSLILDPATTDLADFLKTNPLGLAMSASVDFELLFTISRDAETEVSSVLAELGCPFSVIGHTNNIGRNVLLNSAGVEEAIPGIAWQQQTGDYLQDIIGQERSR